MACHRSCYPIAARRFQYHQRVLRCYIGDREVLLHALVTSRSLRQVIGLFATVCGCAHLAVKVSAATSMPTYP